MAMKREQMDKLEPKIEIGIIAVYLAARILGDVKHVRKTVKRVKKGRSKK